MHTPWLLLLFIVTPLLAEEASIQGVPLSLLIGNNSSSTTSPSLILNAYCDKKRVTVWGGLVVYKEAELKACVGKRCLFKNETHNSVACVLTNSKNQKLATFYIKMQGPFKKDVLGNLYPEEIRFTDLKVLSSRYQVHVFNKNKQDFWVVVCNKNISASHCAVPTPALKKY